MALASLLKIMMLDDSTPPYLRCSAPSSTRRAHHHTRPALSRAAAVTPGAGASLGRRALRATFVLLPIVAEYATTTPGGYVERWTARRGDRKQW